MVGPFNAIVVAPVPLGQGGLGRAGGDFRKGLNILGVRNAFVGPQPLDAMTRLAATRVVRRFSASPQRRFSARAVRAAVPTSGWDLAYAIAGSAPIDQAAGTVAIYQATRYPTIEFEAVRRGEKETGGRGDLSRGELRRRLREVERVDLIHVTTAAVRDEFLNAGVAAEKLVCVAHGVDTAAFRPGVKSEELSIAFVGPLSMRKGVDVVAALAQRMAGAAKVLTVGGPTDPWSRRVAATALFEPRDAVADMLAEAHVLVLPSRSDAFAFVVLEALASGAVPIVTPEVGASEVVRRLDPRLVVSRHEFVERVPGLLEALDLPDLAARGVALAGEYERTAMARAVAQGVLDATARLQHG